LKNKSSYQSAQKPAGHGKKSGKIQEYLSKLNAIPETNYSLWKTTKRLKQPQTHHPPIRK